MQGAHKKVTVLTCTFNRSHTLPRLYQSLSEQTFRDFEWLIVDDGSTDGTDARVADFARTTPFFPVRYCWKPNGGKHTAHNFALPLIEGEYCTICDSDDWLFPGGLTDLVEAWQGIPAALQASFADVEGLTQRPDGELIGSPFPADVFDGDVLSIRWKRARQGDTRGMYRTAVLREFPFPTGFEGQFVAEAIVWNRMARRYRTRFINKVIGGAEYLPGGLSDSSARRMLASLGPRVLYLREMLESVDRAPLAYRARLYASYLRLTMHERTLVRSFFRLPSRALGAGALAAAAALYLRDVLRARSPLIGA